ncbi:MAG: replication-relaxation family protein [Rhizobiaceae bacterium]|nr:replication-relaxation family protein [Rhizobiaceae bacterium]
MKTHDRLGRWLFSTHTKNPIPNFHPDARQIRWMQFLNLHGLASSKYLHELTADTHKCAQTSSRQLRKLFDGQMIHKPRQQRETAGADGNHHIYDLTEKGKAYLKRNGLWIDAHRPTGPWVHQFMVSCITSSIHILCTRNGYTYVPGHEITNSLAVNVPFKWKGKRHSCKLIPDALFAIRYGKGYIAYALEADRNTEPNDPATPYRKSARRNIKQYAEFVGKKMYKKHYGLSCPLVVLNITVSQDHIKRTMPIVEDEIGKCSYLAFGVASEFRTPFQPPKNLLTFLFESPLLRNYKKEYQINRRL